MNEVAFFNLLSDPIMEIQNKIREKTHTINGMNGTEFPFLDTPA